MATKNSKTPAPVVPTKQSQVNAARNESRFNRNWNLLLIHYLDDAAVRRALDSTGDSPSRHLRRLRREDAQRRGPRQIQAMVGAS